MNINTKDYWEKRFKSKDWSNSGGNIQSQDHAEHFVTYLEIPNDYHGTICDVGCAEGDAMSVYRNAWLNASLIGVDFSQSAIESAKNKYSNIAKFYALDFADVPECEVIISSHVFEHLENDIEVIDILKKKCTQLFIIVPYKEFPLSSEHLRTYDEHSYKKQNPTSWKVCNAGWQLSRSSRLYHIYLKNILRPFFNKRIARMPRQIIYEFKTNKL